MVAAGGNPAPLIGFPPAAGRQANYLLVALPDAPVLPDVVELLDAPLVPPVDGVAASRADEPMPELVPLLAPGLPRAGSCGTEVDAPLLPDALPLSPEAEAEEPDGFAEPVAEPDVDPMPEAEPVAEPLALGPEPAQAASASAQVRGRIHLVIRTPLVVRKGVVRRRGERCTQPLRSCQTQKVQRKD